MKSNGRETPFPSTTIKSDFFLILLPNLFSINWYLDLLSSRTAPMPFGEVSIFRGPWVSSLNILDGHPFREQLLQLFMDISIIRTHMGNFSIRGMGHSRINSLLSILDEIQNEIQSEPKQPSRKEALRNELYKLYLHTSLEICKQKLNGSISRDTLAKIQEIKQYFRHIENIGDQNPSRPGKAQE
uniref:Uncharacterized protein n=1 Tax=Encephalitozoon cuniculi TaxID=6035 RepID=M1KAE2_ENCCN|nr:hypothetical protein ECU10_1560 [Encephalitozoon cuniculi]